jgi:hypothetical protein
MLLLKTQNQPSSLVIMSLWYLLHCQLSDRLSDQDRAKVWQTTSSATLADILLWAVLFIIQFPIIQNFADKPTEINNLNEQFPKEITYQRTSIELGGFC